MDENKITYQSAGVDVSKGYTAVEAMKKHIEKTITPGVLGGIGGFGGLFELPMGYQNPVLVSGTDGVGTKLQVAFMMNEHKSIGRDCVAMCVNDIICHGAKPLYFLDYIGTGVLDPQQAADIVEGISAGCIDAGCALIGGETAEMPGFYQQGEYDLAGFGVGIVDKGKLITTGSVQEGAVLLGIASSGLHSNGYSLVRKLCFERKNLSVDEVLPELGKTLGEELLIPTKIYVKLILGLLENHSIQGISHMTGGGWVENIPRMLGDEIKAVVKISDRTPQPIFGLLQKWGHLDDLDMYSTFNMGVGMVLAVAPEDAEEIMKDIAQTDTVTLIGQIEKRKEGEGKIEFL